MCYPVVLVDLERPVLVELGVEAELLAILVRNDDRFHDSVRIGTTPFLAGAVVVIAPLRGFLERVEKLLTFSHRPELIKPRVIAGRANVEDRAVAPWILVIERAPQGDKQRRGKSSDRSTPVDLFDRLAVDIGLEKKGPGPEHHRDAEE